MSDIRKIQSVSASATPTSQFNMSHNRKHTQKMCDLVPNDMMAYAPADRLKGRIATAFNFPPLLAPAYQGFTQKAYMFKVRKGLTWHNDGIKSQLNVLKTGQQTNINEPSMSMTSGAYYGTNLFLGRFCPRIPVYGSKLPNGQVAIRINNTNISPDEQIPTMSINTILQGGLYTCDVLERLKNNENPFVGSFTSQERNGLDSNNPVYLNSAVAIQPWFSPLYHHHNGSSVLINLRMAGDDTTNTDPIRGLCIDSNYYPAIIADSFHDWFLMKKGNDATIQDMQKSARFRAYSHYSLNMDDYRGNKYYSQKSWFNPKGLNNYMPLYVNDGPCQSYSLMESLGYPTFNYEPYIDETSKRIFTPIIDQFKYSVSTFQSNFTKLFSDSRSAETQEEGNEIMYNAVVAWRSGCPIDTHYMVQRFQKPNTWASQHNQAPYLDIKTIGFQPSDVSFAPVRTDLYTLLWDYAIWCIENGYGDGTIPQDSDCPVFYAAPIGKVFAPPFTKLCTGEVDYVKVSLCPWLAYWHVYENYFRDANVSKSLKPLLSLFQKEAAPTLNNLDVQNALRLSSSQDFITHMGVDFSEFAQNSGLSRSCDFATRLAWENDYNHLDTSGDYNYNSSDTHFGTTFVPLHTTYSEDLNFYTLCKRLVFGVHAQNELFQHPRKLLDKDVFTTLLPTTSKIEVFAPTMSQSDISTFLSSTGKEGFFAQYEEIQNQQNPNKAHSAQPISLSNLGPMGNTTTLLSVDAFRTAQTLQNYYRNCSLVGDQINQFIYLTFGVRSKDFRPEVPELVFARETPCHITELTQQSETAELPIGSEAGKMSSSSDSYSFDINSDGDFGYIIYMTCVYPETSQECGFNPLTLVSNNYFNTMFVPQFSKLGEEGITNLFIDATPRYNLLDDGVTQKMTTSQIAEDIDHVVGYAPRYTMFKFMPNTITGRFKSDMNYWTLDRLHNPFSKRTSLNDEYLRSKRDLRIFASDEEQNCYGFTMCQVEVERALACSNLNSII